MNTHESALTSGFDKVMRGTSIVLFSTIINRILEFAVRSALGKSLGPDGFGILSALLGVISVISNLVLLGFSSGLVKFIGERAENNPEIKEQINKLVQMSFWTVVSLSLLVSFVFFLFDKWWTQLLFGLNNDTFLIHTVILVIPLFAGLSIIMASLQALKDALAYSVIINFLIPGMRLTVVILFTALGLGFAPLISFYTWGTIGTIFICSALFLIYQHKISVFVIPDFLKNSLLIKELLAFSLPLLLGSMLGLTVWQVDTILLQKISGAAAAGLYAAALTIGRLPNMILLAFGFMVTPYMAEYFRLKKFRQIKEFYGRSVAMIFMLGLPILGLFIFFPTEIIKSLFGAEYLGAVKAFQIISLGYFMHSVLGPNGNTLIMFGKSRLFLIDTTIAAISSFALYAILIPKYGLMGATFATLIGLTIMNILFSVQIYKYAGINPLRWFRWKLIPVVIMVAIISAFFIEIIGTKLNTWIRLLIAATLMFSSYFSFSILLKIIKLSEIKSYLSAFQRKTDPSTLT